MLNEICRLLNGVSLVARNPARGPAAKPARSLSIGVERSSRVGSGTQIRATKHVVEAGPRGTQSPVDAVIEHAADMGLMTANTHQVGARIPLELLEQAKRRTGIASTTDLLAFALANVALEDNFGKAFGAARGRLDAELDVGF